MSSIGAIVVAIVAVFAIGYLWQYVADQIQGFRRKR